MRGSTMGIIGYGAIGRGVAQRARGFDMEVLAVDPIPSRGRRSSSRRGTWSGCQTC